VRERPAASPVVVPPDRGTRDFAHTDIVADLALLKLAAGEAFERASREVLRRLASDVLGRELMLAPADIDELVRAAISELADAAPVALAISAADAKRVHSPLPVRIDPALVAGDLVVEVRDGSVESHVLFRFESALERAETSG